jgi:hypothetical protein
MTIIHLPGNILSGIWQERAPELIRNHRDKISALQGLDQILETEFGLRAHNPVYPMEADMRPYEVLDKVRAYKFMFDRYSKGVD